MSAVQPRGRPPAGKTWDAATGDWVPAVIQGPPGPVNVVTEAPAPAPPAPTSPRPRGRPPVGKVWDNQNGEYVSSEADTAVPPATGPPFKQPAGRPPAGKVWNPETGEWKAIPGAPLPPPSANPAAASPSVAPSSTSSASGTPSRPRGRPPAGKIWNPLSGQYVERNEQSEAEVAEAIKATAKTPRVYVKKSALLPGGGYRRPPGRGPRDKTWNSETGQWDTVEGSAPPAPPPTKSASTSEPSADKAASGFKKPPGRPPLGKTWNSDTGKWESNGDPVASNTGSAQQKSNSASTGISQPPGRPPANKKWNSKTGEWDADLPEIDMVIGCRFLPSNGNNLEYLVSTGTLATRQYYWRQAVDVPEDKLKPFEAIVAERGESLQKQSPQRSLAPVPAPEVKRAVAAATKRPYVKKAVLPDGTYKRPPGRGPANKVWDAKTGNWIPDGRVYVNPSDTPSASASASASASESATASDENRSTIMKHLDDIVPSDVPEGDNESSSSRKRKIGDDQSNTSEGSDAHREKEPKLSTELSGQDKESGQ